jgi:hypothetical protein
MARGANIGICAYCLRQFIDQLSALIQAAIACGVVELVAATLLATI